MNRSDSTWFDRRLPGRWRVLPGDSNDGDFGDEDLALWHEFTDLIARYPLPDGMPRESRPLSYCAECRHLIVGAEGTIVHSAWRDGYAWSTPTDAATCRTELGDHRHDESYSGDLLRYYVLGGVGPWKFERFGSWAEVFASNPYFIDDGKPVPPKSVLDHLLMLGRRDAGMSGGVEFPSGPITDEAYDQAQASFISDYGCIDAFCPTSLDSEQFLFWSIGWRAGRAFNAPSPGDLLS